MQFLPNYRLSSSSKGVLLVLIRRGKVERYFERTAVTMTQPTSNAESIVVLTAVCRRKLGVRLSSILLAR